MAIVECLTLAVTTQPVVADVVQFGATIDVHLSQMLMLVLEEPINLAEILRVAKYR